MDHSDLQSCVAHISIYLLGVRNVLTSPSKKHGRHCFECFCNRFGNQEMLLSINFHGKSILQRTMKQFGPVATKENGSENRDKRKFACAGVSLHRRFYSLRLIGYVCFSGSAFQFGFLPSKPCFSLKCVTLNSCYTEANPQWIGSFHAERCDWSTKSKTGLFQLSSIHRFDWPSSPRVN